MGGPKWPPKTARGAQGALLDIEMKARPPF